MSISLNAKAESIIMFGKKREREREVGCTLRACVCVCVCVCEERHTKQTNKID